MVSRRDYLQACSAGALAALAGCTAVPLLGGDGDGGGEPELVASQNLHRTAEFGRSVAVDDVLVVGARSAMNDAHNFGGAAFVYERDDDGWRKEARLQPSAGDFAGPHNDDPTGRLSFGAYVATEDGTAVVGTSDSAAAYTYERNGEGWQLTGRLSPNTVDEASSYAPSMAFDGDTVALATSTRDDDDDRVVETVHVFEARDAEWTEVETLLRDEPREWDRYGYSVAVDGDTLAVGSTVGGDEGHDSQQTVVHLYERTDSGWAKQTELRPDAAYSYGGASVHDSIALSGDTLVVGGDQEQTYVYERSDGDWTRRAALRPNALGDDYPFGRPLALHGDALVIATPEAPLDTGVSGSAFLYERSGGDWKLRRRYSESDAVREGEFGYAVALSEDRVAIGGKMRREDLADREVVYAFPR